MDSTDKLLTEAEAARFLATTPGTLTSWRNRKRQGIAAPDIPWITIGRAVRYRKSDLERFLSENTHGAARAAAQ